MPAAQGGGKVTNILAYQREEKYNDGMSFKGEGSMPDTEGPEKKEKREFMREKIVKPPMSKRQIAKRLVLFVCFAAAFGAISAVSFTAARPLADRYLGGQDAAESTPIQFTRDEAETLPPAENPGVETTAPSAGIEEKELREAIDEALQEYRFTKENIYSLSSLFREMGAQADKGIVTVSSGKQQLDLFGNPVESTGDYAGAVIAKTSGELLIFTYADAVRSADSIYITFADGTRSTGTVKQIDEVLDMAVVSVALTDISEAAREQTAVLTLGNSYSVKQGDFVLGIGGPAGMVHSVSQGTVSYIAKNVQMTDCSARVIYADVASNSHTGTFLLNLAGEIIGWTTEEFRTEESTERTIAVSISDYKPVLEKMTNGVEAPYFGVKGQEVSTAMREGGIPGGVYVTEAVSGSPAYDAGIQNGDIITVYNGEEISSFEDLQTQIESSHSGAVIPVTIMRRGRGGYTQLEYEVKIRAR